MSPKSFHEIAAQVHTLKPVVMIGNKGLTEAVQAEINRALDDHELIKIKIACGNSDDRLRIIQEICDIQKAQCVKKIGRIVAIYRQNLNKV